MPAFIPWILGAEDGTHVEKDDVIRWELFILSRSTSASPGTTAQQSSTLAKHSDWVNFPRGSTCQNQSSRSKIMKAANSIWPLCVLTCLTSWYQSRRTFTLIFPIKAAALVLDPPFFFFSFSKKWLLIKAGKSIIHALQSSVDFFVNSCLFPLVSDRIFIAAKFFFDVHVLFFFS